MRSKFEWVGIILFLLVLAGFVCMFAVTFADLLL